jgi:hypothetical protein
MTVQNQFNCRFVVFFSIERLIVVYFPFSNINSHKRRVKKLGISFLCFFAFVLYSVALFTTGLGKPNENSTRCEALPKWMDIVERMALFDIIITIFVPMCFILVVNVLISLKLMSSSRQSRNAVESRDEKSMTTRRNISRIDQLFDLTPHLKLNRLKSDLFSLRLGRKNTSESEVSCESTRRTSNKVLNQIITTGLLVVSNEFSRNSCETLSISAKSRLNRMKTYSKTTRMLLIISTLCFCLNVPMAWSKLRYLIANLIAISTSSQAEASNATLATSSDTTSAGDELSSAAVIDQIIERLSCYLYYLNYSINFVLYTLNGERFKETLVKYFKRKVYRRVTRIWRN